MSNALDPEFTWAKSAYGDIVQLRGDSEGKRMTFVGFDKNGLAMVEWAEVCKGFFVKEKTVTRKDRFRCRDLVRLESPNRGEQIEELLRLFGMDRQGS